MNGNAELAVEFGLMGHGKHLIATDLCCWSKEVTTRLNNCFMATVLDTRGSSVDSSLTGAKVEYEAISICSCIRLYCG